MKTRGKLLFILLTAGWVAACGGTDDGPRPAPVTCRPIAALSDAPDPGGGPVDCRSLDGYELFMLNSFEVGQERTGWYTNNDRTADSDPRPDEDPAHSTEIPGGRCAAVAPSENSPTLCASPEVSRGQCATPFSLESRRAMRIRSGFLSSNGGIYGRKLPVTCDADAPPCGFPPGPPEIGPCSIGLGPSKSQHGCRAVNDFSDWDGVVVWARVGPSSATNLRVRVSDERSDEKACICNGFTNQNDTSNGCDKFGMFFTADATFRAYFVPFHEMQQGGWGLKSPGLDLSNLFEIVIEYGRGAWDVWIDDLAFYRRRP